MRKFKDLEIWHIGFDVMLDVYVLSKTLPNEEKYALGDQIRRAAVSMPSNIAEGCGRSGDLDFKRFLEISLGSSFELETQLLAIQALELSKVPQEKLMMKLDTFQRKTNALITSIKNRNAKK